MLAYLIIDSPLCNMTQLNASMSTDECFSSSVIAGMLLNYILS